MRRLRTSVGSRLCHQGRIIPPHSHASSITTRQAAYRSPVVSALDHSRPSSHPRSDTVDSQRGEVEWRGGNLYYDQWDYTFKAMLLQLDCKKGADALLPALAQPVGSVSIRQTLEDFATAEGLPI